MSNANEQAFPGENSHQTGNSTWHESGLTKLEYFAAMAMQSYISAEPARPSAWIASDAVLAAKDLIICLSNVSTDEETCGASLPDDSAHLFLADLVSALDNSFISSWQTTAGWQKELDAAREFLNENPKEQR